LQSSKCCRKKVEWEWYSPSGVERKYHLSVQKDGSEKEREGSKDTKSKSDRRLKLHEKRGKRKMIKARQRSRLL